MAFTYKNPLEIAINKLPSKQSDQLLAKTFDKIEGRLDLANDLFSFSITPEQQELLINKGVELAPVPFRVHSHPCCKMIENHLLYVVVPSLLSNFKSVAFFSLRESKINKFINMFQVFKYGKISNFKHYNAIIDSKDRCRYGETGFSSITDRIDALKVDCLKANKFPKILFVHDELHFWEPEDVAYLFESIPEISQVIGTTVFPPEMLFGDLESREPRIYELKVKEFNDTFFFYPDGCASEGYRQKISTSKWPFEKRCIRWGTNSIRVSKMYSLFAHHVIAFDRGKSIDGTVHFDKPTCLLRNELNLISDNFLEARMERKTFSSIINYLACLKNANAASAVAKLRQLEKRELYPDELSFLYALASKFSKFGLEDTLTPGLLKRIRSSLVDSMPDSIANWLFEGEHFQINMRKILKEVSTRGLSKGRTILRIENGKYSQELALLITEKLKVNVFLEKDRESAKYSMGPDDLKFKDLDPSISNQLGRELIRLDHPIFSGAFKFKGFSTRLFLKDRQRITPFRLEWKQEEKETGVQSANGNVERPVSSVDQSVHQEDLNEDRGGTLGTVPKDISELCKEVSFKMQTIKDSLRKNSCVFRTIAKSEGTEADRVLEEILELDISEELEDAILEDRGLDGHLIEEVCRCLNLSMICTSDFKNVFRFNSKMKGTKRVYCTIRDNHCELSDISLFRKMLDEGAGSSKDAPSLFPNHLFTNSFGLVSFERAIKLANSINRGTTGLLKENSPDTCKVMCDFLDGFSNESVTLNLNWRLGFAGSGKSHALIKWFKQTSGIRRLVICPRRNLAEDFAEKLKGTETVIKTHESALRVINDGFQEIYLDEITLFPPGYLSLLMIMKFRKRIKGITAGAKRQSLKAVDLTNEKIVLIGDPLQIRYHSDLDANLLSGTSEIDYYLPKKFDYLWQTKRQGKWFKKIIDMPTSDDNNECEIKFHSDLSTIRKASVITCAAQEEKNSLVGRFPVMTFGESQGLTFDGEKQVIVISNNTLKTSPNAAIVAITRCKVGYDLLFLGITPKDALHQSMKNLWSFIIKKEKIPTDRIINMLPGANLTSENIGSLEDKAKFDEFILPFVDLSIDEDFEEAQADEPMESPEWFKTHLPTFDCNPLIGEMFEKMSAKENREFESTVGMSNQFLDIESKSIKNEEVWPMQFQNIFPHHQADDATTFWAGVKKRIRKSNWTEEKRKLDELEGVGNELLNIFLDHLPHRFEVTNEDIEFGRISFNRKRAEKTEKLWENHKERSDIDWFVDHVFLFMKSQFCTKEGKMFTTAKAGQTLACFHHFVLFKFGSMLRAIEKAFIRATGEKFYIHSGKNFFCLDAFVTRNAELMQGQSIESDYEAFDSCQDEVILAFELALLKKLGVSAGFIMDYTRLKLSLNSKIGSFAIMRFTGEFGTFLFNTFANMLFTFLKYDVKSGDRIMFAGDDMCSLGFMRKTGSEKKKKLLAKFSLKAVEEVKKYPSFCGWYISPDGILKSPRLLWSRICFMEQRGLTKTCIDNYLFEAFFAYRLGEKLFQILKEEDFEYHYCVIRHFVKKSRLLSGLAKSLLFEIGESIGRWRLSTSTIFSPELRAQTSRLMPSEVGSFTKMQVSCGPLFSIVSEDLRQTSRSSQKKATPCTSRTSVYLTKKSSISSRGTHKNSSTYMSELCSLQSERCTLDSEGLEEVLSSMMVHVSIGTGRRASYVLRTSHLILTPVISYSDPNTSCQPVIPILGRLSHSKLNWIARSTLRIGNWLQWTLALPIGPLILQDSWTHVLEILDGSPKLYLIVRLLNSMRGFLSLWTSRSCPFFLEAKGQICWFQRGDLGLTKLEGVEVSQHRVEVGGILGLPQGVSKINCSYQDRPFLRLKVQEASFKLKMSLSLKIQEGRRREVLTYLWTNYLQVAGKTLPSDVRVEQGVWPADDTEAQKVSRRKFDVIISFYCKYLFGNVAIYGASESTVYPNASFDTPSVTFKQPAAGEGPEVTTSTFWTINLHRVVPAIKTFCRESNMSILKDATWRNICEAFAKEAYNFLKEKFPEGVTTAIYDKWPKAFESAPHMAFDFAAGLKMCSLSPSEKKVIDRMTKRLFRTEGQKGIFEAATDQNMEMEG
uniref:Polyprotein n=1 Tax=Avellana capillovirus 1 TaxID=2794427 RepID=A0A7T5UFS9_9VIRU|nr:polyprotein [Avellana capillovirus 1]